MATKRKRNPGFLSVKKVAAAIEAVATAEPIVNLPKVSEREALDASMASLTAEIDRALGAEAPVNPQPVGDKPWSYLDAVLEDPPPEIVDLVLSEREAKQDPGPPIEFAPGYHPLPTPWLYRDASNVRVVQAGKDADDELAASIKANGILQPIIVEWWPAQQGCFEDCYRIVAGHRRHAMAERVGLPTVPCLVMAGLTEGQRLAVQITENMARADMTAADQWVAVARLTDEGMSDTAIAMTLGLTERRVVRFRLMGQMAPAIIQHIREHDDYPDEREVAEIAQAPMKQQELAFKGARHYSERGKRRMYWSEVARACEKRRIRMCFALFPVEDYTKAGGTIFRDLFTDEADPEAEADDPALFMKLQRAAMEKMRAKAEGAGWAGAVILPDTNSYSVPAPNGCTRDWVPHGSKNGPRKDDRPNWVWAIRLDQDGKADIRNYRLLPKPKPVTVETVDPETGEVTTQTVQPAGPAVSAPTKNALPPLTHEFVEKLCQHKRTVAATAVLETWDLPKLATIMLLLLVDRAMDYRDRGKVEPLLDDEGVPTWDDVALVETARPLLAQWIGKASGGASFDDVQRIGKGLGWDPTIPLQRKDLDGLRGDALERIAKARKILPRDTLIKTRNAIMASEGAKATEIRISPAELAEVGWKVTLPFGVKKEAKAEAVAEAVATADRLNERDAEPMVLIRVVGPNGEDLGDEQEAA